MEYLAMYPDAYIWYHGGDMQLHIYNEAAYIVFTKARSIITGFYHLTNTPHAGDRFLEIVRY